MRKRNETTLRVSLVLKMTMIMIRFKKKKTVIKSKTLVMNQ